jgi:hypothetical protein
LSFSPARARQGVAERMRLSRQAGRVVNGVRRDGDSQASVAGVPGRRHPPSLQGEENGHWSPVMDHPFSMHMTAPPMSVALHASRARVVSAHSPGRISHQKDSRHIAVGPHAARILLQNASHSGVPDTSPVEHALPTQVWVPPSPPAGDDSPPEQAEAPTTARRPSPRGFQEVIFIGRKGQAIHANESS